MKRYRKKKLKGTILALSSSAILASSLFLSYEVLKMEEASPAVFKEESHPLEEFNEGNVLDILPVPEVKKPQNKEEKNEQQEKEEKKENIKTPLEFNEEEEKSLPPIPEGYKKRVIEADLSYKDNKTFLHTHGISLKNSTQYSNEEVAKLLDTPMKMRFKETQQPQFLIYHTHATESFNPRDGEFYDSRYNWRSRDNTINMVSVGDAALCELEKAGIPYIHDTSQHDYPSYNGSYKNSYNSVSKIMSENKEIKVALDLHRDAIEKDSGEITKPVLILEDGTKLAQIMIIANCDDGSGLIPNWRENFRFAKELYLALEDVCPGICRPILLANRKYNQQLSTGALLIEVGGHGNTVPEVQRSGKVLGLALKEIYENFKE